MGKCTNGGLTIKPDGIHELDPCSYLEVEKYKNVTVTVLKCKRCGHIEVLWTLQDNTEKIMGKEVVHNENQTS